MMQRHVSTEIGEMYRVLELLNTHFDEQENVMNPECWIFAFRECFSTECLLHGRFAFEGTLPRKELSSLEECLYTKHLQAFCRPNSHPLWNVLRKKGPAATPAQTAPSFAPATPETVTAGGSAPTGRAKMSRDKQAHLHQRQIMAVVEQLITFRAELTMLLAAKQEQLIPELVRLE